MPAISFSAVEILPALLNRTKKQTIRPGKPRMKVGDIVTLYWKQRTSPKGARFCKVCGTQLKNQAFQCFCNKNAYDASFPKILGKVKITEVFEIEMWMGIDAPLVTGYSLKDTHELAKRDGFKTGKDGKYKDFYNYFYSKRYNWLDKPTGFTVYRWK